MTPVHGEGQNSPVVVTVASNSPTAPTYDPNHRRGRQPWTIATPLGHTPRRIHLHRRSSPATRLAFPGGIKSPPLLSLSLSMAVRSTRVYRGALGKQGGTQGVLIPRSMRPQRARFSRELNGLAEGRGGRAADSAPWAPLDSQTHGRTDEHSVT
jgi:hypothetical protein